MRDKKDINYENKSDSVVPKSYFSIMWDVLNKHPILIGKVVLATFTTCIGGQIMLSGMIVLIRCYSVTPIYTFLSVPLLLLWMLSLGNMWMSTMNSYCKYKKRSGNVSSELAMQSCDVVSLHSR
jgi:hypothetical protein